MNFWLHKGTSPLGVVKEIACDSFYEAGNFGESGEKRYFSSLLEVTEISTYFQRESCPPNNFILATLSGAIKLIRSDLNE